MRQDARREVRHVDAVCSGCGTPVSPERGGAWAGWQRRCPACEEQGVFERLVRADLEASRAGMGSAFEGFPGLSWPGRAGLA